MFLKTHHAALLGVLLLASGCTDYRKQINDLNDRIAETNRQVGELGKNMVVAADKVDPLALKEIYREVKDLRELNDKLNKAIAGATNDAAVTVSAATRTEFEITGYSGSFELSAWVDDPKYDFISDQALQGGEPPQLEVPFNKAAVMVEAAGAEAFAPFGKLDNWGPQVGLCLPTGGGPAHTFALRMASLRTEIDGAYKSAVDAAFGAYLQQPFTRPATNMRYHAINLRFHSAGDHTIYLRVKPLKEDSLGGWSLNYRAYVVNTALGEDRHDGPQFLVGSIRSTGMSYKLGVPLPVKQHVVRVGIKS